MVAGQVRCALAQTPNCACPGPHLRRLMAVQVRQEEIIETKQDKATAITIEDVNVATSRAVDHADRRADSIMKSIGGAFCGTW